MASESELHVRIRPDGSEATLIAPAGMDRSAVRVETTTVVARQAGVEITQAVGEALAAFATAYGEGASDLSQVIARATPPRPGTDGRMEWASDHDPTVSHRLDGESGRSDHYAGKTYVRVAEGKAVGVLHAPTEPQPGRDVRGREIKAALGRPVTIKFHPTLQVDDAGRVTARVAGVLVFERNELKVSQLLEIAGGVDFSTGNIDFPGNITIAKGVCAGFKVKAGGDLTIGGLIEAAEVICSGNLSARTGMAGQGRGALTVGGNAHVVYLEQVRGAVRGDFAVDREISDCRLIVGGRLHSPGGTILGGEVAVTDSLVIKVLGSARGTATTLVLDDAPFVRAARAGAGKALADAEARLAKLDREERTIMVNPRPGSRDKERLTEIAFETNELNRAISTADNKMTELDVLLEATRKLNVNVVGVIHAGVTMRIGDLRAEFTTPRRGPLWIFRDERGEPAYRLGSTGAAKPLTDIARVSRGEGAAPGKRRPGAAA